MRVFITGATGFIGGHVAEQLIKAGHEVIALVRTPAKAHGLEAIGVELAPGDLLDETSLRAGMTGVDAVFHLAAWYQVGNPDPELAKAANVEGTRNVLELAQELEVGRVVYTSTLAVNGDTGGRAVDESYRHEGRHLSVYDQTKWQAHHEVAVPMIEQGLPLTIVMPGVTYGPGDTSAIATLWRDHLTGDLPAIPQRTAYCWGHVEDTARGHLLALEKGQPGETYIIAGHPMTLEEVFQVTAKITGRAPPKALPPWVFSAMAGGARIAELFTRLPDALSSEGLRVLAGNTYLGSNAKAAHELGLEHRPVEEGLAETLAAEAEALGLELPA